MPSALLRDPAASAIRLSPAHDVPRARDGGRLLVIDPRRRRFVDATLGDLPAQLRAGDLLVLNDAATLPASLRAQSTRGPIEVRLLARNEDGSWQAVLFGAGDFRTPTELRGAPPVLQVGDGLSAGGLSASVRAVSALSPRLVELDFAARDAAFWQALYASGVPVQYSHQRTELDLWSVQTAYAAEPCAVEMPSAGRPLSFRLLQQLRARGVELATLTHAAGLSATGDVSLDQALPLPERFRISATTIARIDRARVQGGRVIAVGTSVVRALEGVAQAHGRLVPGTGITDLRIGPRHRLAVADGVLSGAHVPGESHFELLRAFAELPLLTSALRHAAQAGYRAHEFGDSALVWSALARR